MNTRTKLAFGAGVVLLALALFGNRLAKRDDAPAAGTPATSGSGGGTAAAREPAAPAPSEPAASVAAAPATPDGAAGALLRARWGAGDRDLGRERPQEGNPEGPMSLALAGDDLFVLDQVNGRLARYDRSGRLERHMDVPGTVQDLAIAKDGSIALIDRLAGKAVTLLDANGRKIGELPLASSKVGETGLVTGVFVDGKDVYAEKEHGALVHLGTTEGGPAEDKQLTGRPSKDGTLLLTAGLASAREGKAFLNALDRRTGTLRFSRVIAFPRPARTIALLDTDARGGIYLGVIGGPDGLAHVVCADPGDGHVTGRLALETSDTPEESFRDYVVGDDGTIVYAVRDESGVEYRTARCP